MTLPDLYVGYQASVHRSVRALLLEKSGQLPDLELGEGMKFHLFLSHSA